MDTPTSLQAPVCILGGGPGGSTVAMQLARHGVQAVLLEKATFPRDKVCGDALSGKVMRTLERLDPALAAMVKRDGQAMPSWGVTFVAPSGRSLRVPFSRETGVGDAPGVILPRLRFDELLFRHAGMAPGITVLEGTTAKTFERTPQGWRVEAQRGEERIAITSRLIIDASGANSSFARHVAGLPMEPRHHAAGVRAYYRGVQGLDPKGFIELHFLPELLPGYLWIFPLPEGRANVGLGLRSDMVRQRKVDVKALFHDLLATHPTLKERFSAAVAEGPVQGMGLPLASKRYPLSGDGYLLVGDAGHLIDPFTGEGISHAMISGVHAADVAADMVKRDVVTAGEAKPYEARVWRRLGQEVAISTRLQQLSFKPWLFNFVVDRANRNPALADTISSMFTDLDLRARLKKPGFYLDLVLGRRPGQ
ncbi:MAG TPA: geranylgeranyl reductase family protein [Flavobacteriales bacterium]|nr:geranylgeranyl reductase family protein [Flavobacteriales bacterium]